MNARTKLKEAGAAIGKLNAEIAQLEESLTRSKEIASEAEETLAGFDKLDSAITRYRAEAVKSGRDPRKLPEDLKQQTGARKAAQDEVEQASETVELLSKELGDAKDRLKRLQPDLAPFAADVLLEESAAALAQELHKLEQRRLELRTVLTGFANLTYFDPTTQRYVTFAASGSIRSAFGSLQYQYPVMANPAEDQMQRWRAQLVALINNPDAPTAEVRPILPTDYEIVSHRSSPGSIPTGTVSLKA